MLFKNKNSAPSLDALKSEFPDVYQAAYLEGANSLKNDLEALKAERDTLVGEVRAINATKAETERVSKINAYAVKLGVDAETVEHCLKEGISFADAVVYMVDNKKETQTAQAHAVAQSAASLFNGSVETKSPSADSADVIEPTTLVEAMVMIKERDKCGTEEARRKACAEFPQLFAKMTGMDVSDDKPDSKESTNKGAV